MVNEKYWIFGKYSPELAIKWKTLLSEYDLVFTNNPNIMLMVSSYVEHYINSNTGSELITVIIKVINEYLTDRITLSKKIKHKQYNYINNSEELVLEDDSIVRAGEVNELDDDLFYKINQMLVILANYNPPKKKMKDIQIEGDIKLKLEPLFRKKKINKFLKDD